MNRFLGFLLTSFFFFIRVSAVALSICISFRTDSMASGYLFELGSFYKTVNIGIHHIWYNPKHDHIASFSILDALAPEADAFDDHDDCDSILETASVIITSNGRPPSAILGTRVANYDLYRRRLEPLIELEGRLIRLLSVPEEDEKSRLEPSNQGWHQYTNVYNNESLAPPSKIHPPPSPNRRPSPSISIPQRKLTTSSHNESTASSYHSSVSIHSTDSMANEIAIHTSTDWKRPFKIGTKSKSPKSAHTGEIEGWWEDPEDPVHTLNACAPAMQELWRDHQVRKCLDEKRLRLEESSGL